MSTDKGGRFADTLKEADRHDGLGVAGRGGDHGEGAPEEHHEGEPDARLDVLEGQVRWDLAQDISAGRVRSDWSLRVKPYPTVKQVKTWFS